MRIERKFFSEANWEGRRAILNWGVRSNVKIKKSTHYMCILVVLLISSWIKQKIIFFFFFKVGLNLIWASKKSIKISKCWVESHLSPKKDYSYKNLLSFSLLNHSKNLFFFLSHGFFFIYFLWRRQDKQLNSNSIFRK